MFKPTSTHLHWSKRRWLFIATAVVMLTITATIWLNHDVAEVHAKSSFMTSFRNTYPATTGTQLDDCIVCHTNIPSRNSYGNDYRSNNHNLFGDRINGF